MWPSGYPGTYSGLGYSPVWWGLPVGWTDYLLYDYNNNQTLDDNEIADAVLDNVEADPGIPLSDEHKVKAQVNNGVVTLSGIVNSPRTKPFAYVDAYWTAGVKDVVNNIEVQPTRQQQPPQVQQQAEKGVTRRMSPK